MKNRQGYAVVFDGHKCVLDTRFPKKRPITKAEFMKLWPTLDEDGRKELIRTVYPVKEEGE